jgi:hypothetical protein
LASRLALVFPHMFVLSRMSFKPNSNPPVLPGDLSHPTERHKKLFSIMPLHVLVH